MLNYIWSAMILISYLFSVLCGNTEEVNGALLAGAQAAVEMSIGILGMMCFWSGLLEIAKKSKLTEVIKKKMRPLTKFLFPDLPKNSPAIDAILMNMVANFLGLSNAATPLGLKAMAELDKENKKREKASDAMCMFVVINTAAITLMPTTLMAMRAQAGAHAPFEVILPIWICSISAATVGVMMIKIMSKRGKNKW